MAETTADVRRDIEMTRERISSTLAQLEQKTNVVQIVRDHPWPALAAAVGIGVLLSGTRADVKAAGATVAATKGASSKLGGVLDDAVANLMGGVHSAFQGHVDSIVSDIKRALGVDNLGTRGSSSSSSFGAKMASGGSTGGGTAVGNGSSSFAGSGASANPLTASGASGLMGGTAGGASASSTSGAWAPQTPNDLSSAQAPNPNNTPGTSQSTGEQNFQTGRAD